MESLTLKKLEEIVMKQAEEKGFGTKPEEINVAEKMALIHSEVSEAFEAYRHKNIEGKDGFSEEMGDIVQRVIHLCGILGIDLEQAIIKKIEHNNGRKWDWTQINEKRTE